MPVFRPLFVPAPEPNQPRLIPRAPEKRDAGGQPAFAGVAHRHRDGGEARRRRVDLAVVTAWRREIADRPRWIAPRGIDESIEPLVVHHLRERRAEGFAIG